MAPQTPNIRRLDREVATQVAGKRKIENMRIRRFQFVVHPPVDSKPSRLVHPERRSHWKRPGNHPGHVLATVLSLRQVVDTGEAKCAVYVLDSLGIGLGCRGA